MENTEVLQRVEDFHEVINVFSEILIAENTALNDYDIDIIRDLCDRKSKVVSAYRSLTAYLIKNQTELNAIEEEKRNTLKDATKKLDELLKENEMLLKTRMHSSQTVMDTIVNIAKVTNNTNATSYGAQGKYSPLDNSANAIAVNRTL